MTTLFPEASNWRNGMRAVSAGIDDTFGETVEVIPVLPGKPNFPGTPQPLQAVTVTAVFTNEAKTVLMGNEHQYKGHSLSPLVTTSEPIFQFDNKALPWPLRQGYHVKLCRTGETFEVTNVKPDGVARITVNVVQLGKPR